MVTQFVGFLGAYRQAAGIDNLGRCLGLDGHGMGDVRTLFPVDISRGTVYRAAAGETLSDCRAFRYYGGRCRCDLEPRCVVRASGGLRGCRVNRRCWDVPAAT